MKVYRIEKRVVMVGKAWEIRYMLKKYSRQFKTVKEWIEKT
ncbi:Z-ring formation inhibitor MciZ [Metabacillus arenae]|uniref:Z-ring formation inhibitor MciZ n=1 Tax=Metabacillus arenae TaxID=2771434 RepID=A0A926NE20_9BACI|nr:Z-ring formation inhibitor MciZ [Metabacillus arenae]MBD1378718.1 Z-ring formation inhibitor MciZ [Metabacillus arenae]